MRSSMLYVSRRSIPFQHSSSQSSMQYPKNFTPNTSESVITKSGVIAIPSVHMTFRPWTGIPLADTWGGKAVIDYRGQPLFAELAIMQTAIDDGWDARWLETYSMKNGVPFHFMTWTGHPLHQNESELITDDSQLQLLKRIATVNGTYYGCWDVIVWQGDNTLLVESKRRKADTIRRTQVRWLEAALRTGLKLENFLIVQWDFIA